MTPPEPAASDAILGTTADAIVQAIADGLAGPGWAITPGFVSSDLVATLAHELDGKLARGELRAAAVGAGAQRAVRREIRGDLIQWLAGEGSDAEREVLARLDAVRVGLNGALQLGLHELECHYAAYPPGAFYARHLDRSPAGVERVVSVVLYLNPDWLEADGGELRLHAPGGAVDVTPYGGTLATFLSDSLEHEVRPARRVRRSLTGWFRRRPLGTPFV
jgi:SM-20-related protein